MTKYALEIINVSKKYHNYYALKDINIKIKTGKIVAILGPDGSGKTTLLRLIAGLICAQEGKILTLGYNPVLQKSEISKLSGYMPQKFGLYEDLTVVENIKIYSQLKKDEQSVDKMLDFIKLKQFKNRLTRDLSGGMKQKLALACAMLSKPKLLILDEPSVGVDPLSRLELLEFVKQMINFETTVIWSSSYLDESYNFDFSIILNEGKIIFSGDTKALGDNYEIFENKVIEFMGGYKKHDSTIAKNYHIKENNINCCVLADKLSKRYGDFWAVKENSFCIQKGEIFGLLGPNGAGKSTTFKMMCALIKPTSGKGYIMGVDVEKYPEKARSYLGYMAQRFSLYQRLSVLDNLNFFAGIYGLKGIDKNKKIKNVLRTFDLEQYSNNSSFELPLGYKQRLSLACALIHQPDILFLDEPTSGVDVIQRREFWNHIKELSKIGVSTLVTTHFMDEARYCDNIGIFYNGKIIALDKPDALILKTNSKNMQETFIKLIKEQSI